MDKIDSTLLEMLQTDSRTSHADLAKAVGLSATGIHKRLKRLESQGYIKKFTAVLNRERLGLDLLCILMVTFKTNLTVNNLQGLEDAINRFPQVLECYTLTGSYDAVIKIAVRDRNELRAFLRAFADAQNVIERVQTGIVLEEVRESFELPLPAVDSEATADEK